MSTPVEPELRVLVDRGCPLCRREERLLTWLDRDRGRVAFEDISAPGFDPAAWGLDDAEVMARLHGIGADGEVITGMEVFRRAYRAVGLGWLAAPTAWPGLRTVFDGLYTLFARNRLRLTGRCDAACRRSEEKPATVESD